MKSIYKRILGFILMHQTLILIASVIPHALGDDPFTDYYYHAFKVVSYTFIGLISLFFSIHLIDH